jgi:hypothetical protein
MSEIKIRINKTVPTAVIEKLAQRRGKYSDLVEVFHCIYMGAGRWIGVAGDGGNASYEHFVAQLDKNGSVKAFDCSDVGYGITTVALRDILNAEEPL